MREQRFDVRADGKSDAFLVLDRAFGDAVVDSFVSRREARRFAAFIERHAEAPPKVSVTAVRLAEAPPSEFDEASNTLYANLVFQLDQPLPEGTYNESGVLPQKGYVFPIQTSMATYLNDNVKEIVTEDGAQLTGLTWGRGNIQDIVYKGQDAAGRYWGTAQVVLQVDPTTQLLSHDVEEVSYKTGSSRRKGARTVTTADIEEWINNDPKLSSRFTGSGLSMAEFIKQNRSKLLRDIEDIRDAPPLETTGLRPSRPEFI